MTQEGVVQGGVRFWGHPQQGPSTLAEVVDRPLRPFRSKDWLEKREEIRVARLLENKRSHGEISSSSSVRSQYRNRRRAMVL